MSDIQPKSPTRITRIIGWVGFAILLSAAFMIFAFFYAIFFPTPITTFRETDNLPINKKVVHAGDTVGVTVNYCKRAAAISNITVGLVDHQLSNTFTTVRELPVGCHKTSMDIAISKTVPPDSYHFLIEIQYSTRLPFYSEVHELSSAEFEVVP